jgi:hypothetical protein
MPTIEERVAYLEGRLGDHFAAVDDLRSTSREFHVDSNRQFAEARAALELLRADTAREFSDVRGVVELLRTDTAREFGEVRARSDDLRGELRQEMGRLDSKMDTQFRWLAGMQVTSILAIGSAALGLYFK